LKRYCVAEGKGALKARQSPSSIWPLRRYIGGRFEGVFAGCVQLRKKLSPEFCAIGRSAEVLPSARSGRHRRRGRSSDAHRFELSKRLANRSCETGTNGYGRICSLVDQHSSMYGFIIPEVIFGPHDISGRAGAKTRQAL